MGLRSLSELYVTSEKIDTVSTAGKLRGTPTDNGFKQVQITYLAVISNLDKLVQLSYTLSKFTISFQLK